MKVSAGSLFPLLLSHASITHVVGLRVASLLPLELLSSSVTHPCSVSLCLRDAFAFNPGVSKPARQQSSVYKYPLVSSIGAFLFFARTLNSSFSNPEDHLPTTTNMAPSHKRKRSQATTSPTIQLKPLKGAQIEAVTRTYNDLRAAGVHTVVDLPATVVAGDTSSGKSSVMCRLTGLPFPRGDDVVTKFATEVDMMPAETDSIQVTIRPHDQRSDAEKAALLQWGGDIKLEGFAAIFEQASLAMAKGNGGKLYEDVLHISFKGPTCPPLTVIDIPGLIHTTTRKVSDADRRLSSKLAKQYLSEKRTIVLAVVSADNDIVNQRITKMTRDVDKQGERTLGIVTKVDVVFSKAKDRQLLELLSDEVIPLQLGWHALVNAIETKPEATDQQIAQAEHRFFQDARFKALDKGTTGIDNLRTRVVEIVGRKLVNTLPALSVDVVKKLDEASKELTALGIPIRDLNSQRKYLMKICTRFVDMTQAGIDGVDSKTYMAASHELSLRSKIEDLHDEFSEAMWAFGTTRSFVGLGTTDPYKPSAANAYHGWSKHTTKISAQEAITWVTQVQNTHARGGMHSSVNNQIVAQIVRELARNWAKCAHDHIENLAATCRDIISKTILDRSSRYASGVADQIESTWIHQHIDAKLNKAKVTLDELWAASSATLSAHSPRLPALKDAKVRQFPTVGSSSGAVVMATTNLAHAAACYEIDLEYWINAIIKLVAEPLVRNISQALSAEMVLDLSEAQIKKVMTESKELSKDRKGKQDTVARLQFALGKLDAQLTALSED